MKTLNKLAIVAAVSASLSTGLIGCSSDTDTSGSSFVSYERVAPLATQTATISIADPLGTPVVTITQAESITLDAAATTDGLAQVMLEMSLVNNVGRLLFNPKVVPTGVSQGTLANNTGNINFEADSLANLPYYGFGLGGIDDGAAAQIEDQLTVIGLDGTVDPLVIEVELPTTHSTTYHNGGDNPSGPDGEVERVDIMGDRADSQDYGDIENGGAYAEGNHWHNGAQSHDGKTLYFGNRNLPAVIVYDALQSIDADRPLVTRIGIAKGLVSQNGYVPSVSMSPDGQFLYATVIESVHEDEHVPDDSGSGYFTATGTYLVKINATSHEVISHLVLEVPGREGGQVKPRDININADGTLAVVALDAKGAISLVDLTGDMSVVKTFDLFIKGYGVRIRTPAISPDGSTVYFHDAADEFSTDFFSSDSTNNIVAIDVETEVFTMMSVSDPINDNPHQLEFGPDGRLYHVGDGSQVNVYDVDTMSLVAVYDNNTNYDHFAFDGEGAFLHAMGGSGTDVYDISDDTYTDLSQSNSSGVGFGMVSPY